MRAPTMCLVLFVTALSGCGNAEGDTSAQPGADAAGPSLIGASSSSTPSLDSTLGGPPTLSRPKLSGLRIGVDRTLAVEQSLVDSPVSNRAVKVGAGLVWVDGRIAGLDMMDIDPEAVPILVELYPMASSNIVVGAEMMCRQGVIEAVQKSRASGISLFIRSHSSSSRSFRSSLSCLTKLSKSLERLTCPRDLQNSDLGPLRDLTSLKVLDLSNTAITDDGVIQLTRLQGLEVLKLDDTAITGAGMAHVAKLPKLRRLDVARTNVADYGLEFVGAMSGLEIVNLGMREVHHDTDTLFSRITKRVALAEPLSLVSATSAERELEGEATQKLSKVTDAGLHHIASLALLRELYLADAKITDAGLAIIGKMKSLRHLDLSGTAITNEGLKHLSSVGSLEVLDLSYTKVGDEGVGVIATSLPNLRALGLNGTTITDNGVARLGELSNLQTLWIGKTRVTDASLENLKQLTNLQALALTDDVVTNEGLAKLAGLRGLRFLYLSGTRITDDGVQHLLSLTNLETLYLDQTSVTAAGLVKLRGLKKLRALAVPRGAVSCSSLQSLEGTLAPVSIASGDICSAMPVDVPPLGG